MLQMCFGIKSAISEGLLTFSDDIRFGNSFMLETKLVLSNIQYRSIKMSRSTPKCGLN